MPLDLQVRLLRVLQEKEIDPLGAKLAKKSMFALWRRPTET
ncbi:sigma 54-interacting transcriptional regulator [Dyadobacter beijingensis]